MIKVNVFEAKARLSEYLDRASRGERIVVCRHNKPIAELRCVAGMRTEPRPVGPLPGRPIFDVPASFFEPIAADELELWEGETPAPQSLPISSSKGATRVPRRRTRRQTGKPGPRRQAGQRR